MLRSLIVDPMIAQAVIALAEERKKTRVRATVGRETDLLVLASEGQLSGVNLAVQLSMALAFRWSRWPAVLLDDPAQYSDVVHSTNLVETLRVLALHHGFQVFLATHERDFAMFVERKFRNDGLPATRVMFRQSSDLAKGVVPRVAAVQEGAL
jgi:ABC-type hemin transport system ATPase subunit